MKNAAQADVLIIGGGLIGVSTAMHLIERYPGISVMLLEKESRLAAHQSGHNSGVIHAGVYYAPGSFKAEFCKKGATAAYAFSERHGIATEQCGKLIVATNDVEHARLNDLYVRCQQNGLQPEMLNRAALQAVEPRIAGLCAIRVTSSGIADYPGMARKMAALAEAGGAQILLDHAVSDLREEADGVTAVTQHGDIRARHAIVCAGLMADRLAAMCGVELDFLIIPFRGEYYKLPDVLSGIVSHLIYPVPDPGLPFLGVHLTRMINGCVTVGPNAVLALAREGYCWRNLNLRDLAEMAGFGGFWKMLGQNGASGAIELKNSIWKRGYLQLCRKYCPELQLSDLEPYPSGVRAQAVMADGSMVHDFLIRRSKRSLHVINAPSPAATAAIPIGAHLVAQFGEIFRGEPKRPV